MAERIDLENLATQISSLDNGRRFSSLNSQDLVSLWLGTFKFIHDSILERKKSFFIPAFGYFTHSKKQGGFGFIPAQTWLKFGHEVKSTEKKKPDSEKIETINYAQIASTMSVSKVNVELAFKEIILRIIQIIKLNKPIQITLSCLEMGILHISTKPLKFKLIGVETKVKKVPKDCDINTPNFLDAQNDPIVIPTGPLPKPFDFMLGRESIKNDGYAESFEKSLKHGEEEQGEEWPRFVIRSCNF